MNTTSDAWRPNAWRPKEVMVPEFWGSRGGMGGERGNLADIGWKHNLCRARDLRDLEQFY